MNCYGAYIEIGLPIIAIIISLIAVFQTNKQIKLSNKHNLFDRRLNTYLMIKEFIDSYKEYSVKSKLSNDTDLSLYSGLILMNLMNNLYFEPVMDEIYDSPLNRTKIKEFYLKITGIRRIATEIDMIFTSDISKPINDFLTAYENTIVELYKYYSTLKFAECDPGLKNLSYEDKARQVGEEKFRKKVCDELNQLNRTYSKILEENIEANMKRYIKF